MRRILISLLLSALLCCLFARLLCTGLCICLPKTPIPTEAQLRSYLEGVDTTRVPALVSTLQSVQDEESARLALAEIFRLGCRMREDYERQWKGGFDTTPELYSLAELAHLEQTCAALLEVEKEHIKTNRERYRPLFREVERLRAADYYGLPTLGAILHLYVVDEVAGEPLLLWYPGSQLREAAARQEKRRLRGNAAANRNLLHVLWRDKHYVSAGREQHLDLLFLDLCHQHGLRQHEDILFYPYSPLIRNGALASGAAWFADCMCAGFCLAAPPPAPQPCSELPLPYRHPLSLLSMSEEDIRHLPEYLRRLQLGKSVKHVLKLQPPFISPYLLIQTDDGERPDALYFLSEEEMERHEAAAARESAPLTPHTP